MIIQLFSRFPIPSSFDQIRPYGGFQSMGLSPNHPNPWNKNVETHGGDWGSWLQKPPGQLPFPQVSAPSRPAPARPAPRPRATASADDSDSDWGWNENLRWDFKTIPKRPRINFWVDITILQLA
jgi:hypothetical protein